MSVAVVTAVIVTGVISITIKGYMNRRRPLKNILWGVYYTIGMQIAGVSGVIEDWVTSRRNRIELPDANRRIVVITGGARGIGLEVVRGLLKANTIVIIGIRKPEVANKLVEQFENGENLHAFKLDLLSLKSVQEFADTVLEKFPMIHILINNAGIMFGDYTLTEDGLESQLAVNHLGHFYLTHLLLPALKKGSNVGECSRVVNVSSCIHYMGKIDFDDINSKEFYDPTRAYAQSKLAQLMTTRYINKLLEENGDRVRCYAVHPGIVDTDLFEGSYFRTMFSWAMKLLFKVPEKGAVSILYACFNKELEEKGGLYISNCAEGISNRFSKNVDYQKKLFEVSCELVNINKDSFGRAQ